MQETTEMSFGQKAVGFTFNPSNDENVQKIKTECAKIIDTLNDLRLNIKSDLPGASDRLRMIEIAITEIQSGQMWGVKAVTWKD